MFDKIPYDQNGVRQPSQPIRSQLDDLRSMEDGWLEGGGIAPLEDGLDWLANAFESHYPPELPRPYCYPTPEGGIQAEWDFRAYDIDVKVDLSSQHAVCNMFTKAMDGKIVFHLAENIDLSDVAGWDVLSGKIRRAINGPIFQ